MEHQRKSCVLSPKLKKCQFDAEHRRTLTKEDLDRISADIWRDQNDDKSRVSTVQGKAEKRPPLSYEAKHALSEIRSKVSLVDFKIQRLIEPSLKGLAFEARELAKTFSEDSSLWRVVADECDRRREILARYRSGKGEWYAVVEIFQKDGPRSARSIDQKFEKCISKKEAVLAAQTLLAEHASRFSDTVSIDVSVRCDLEWAPPKD